MNAPRGSRNDHREVVLEFFDGEPDDLREIAAQHPEEITLLESKRFSAAVHTIQAVVVLTPVVTAQIVRLVSTYLDARKAINIKADGVELTGLSADDAVKVLKELSGPGDSAAGV